MIILKLTVISSLIIQHDNNIIVDSVILEFSWYSNVKLQVYGNLLNDEDSC